MSADANGHEREKESDHGHEQDAVRAGVRQVRVGHGANCSSIGSVVDTLFATAAVGAAVFAAVLAALKTEPVRVVSREGAADPPVEPRL